MKRTVLVLIVLCTAMTALTQDSASAVSHKGFYMSMAIGPAFGNIQYDYNENGTNNEIKGEALGLDLQIGGAIKPNLILHATVQDKTIVGPKINGVKLDNDHLVQEYFYGAGMTKYTAQNFFFTGNIGVGHFRIDTLNSSDGMTTDPGFSFNVRIGKEWMVSRKWGLGGALFYSMTTLDNASAGYSEHWNSNRLGLYFQATLCRAK